MSHPRRAYRRAHSHGRLVKPGGLAQVIRVLVFHILMCTYGTFLLILSTCTLGGMLLGLCCMCAGSMNSGRRMVIFFWKIEDRINRVCAWTRPSAFGTRESPTPVPMPVVPGAMPSEHEQSGRPQQQERTQHESEQSRESAAPNADLEAGEGDAESPIIDGKVEQLMPSMLDPHEVTTPFLVLSMLYFLYLRPIFDVVVSAIPLCFWEVAIAALHPNSDQFHKTQVQTSKWALIGTVIACAVLAHFSGVKLAQFCLFVTEKCGILIMKAANMASPGEMVHQPVLPSQYARENYPPPRPDGRAWTTYPGNQQPPPMIPPMGTAPTDQSYGQYQAAMTGGQQVDPSFPPKEIPVAVPSAPTTEQLGSSDDFGVPYGHSYMDPAFAQQVGTETQGLDPAFTARLSDPSGYSGQMAVADTFSAGPGYTRASRTLFGDHVNQLKEHVRMAAERKRNFKEQLRAMRGGNQGAYGIEGIMMPALSAESVQHLQAASTAGGRAFGMEKVAVAQPDYTMIDKDRSNAAPMSHQEQIDVEVEKAIRLPVAIQAQYEVQHDDREEKDDVPIGSAPIQVDSTTQPHSTLPPQEAETARAGHPRVRPRGEQEHHAASDLDEEKVSRAIDATPAVFNNAAYQAGVEGAIYRPRNSSLTHDDPMNLRHLYTSWSFGQDEIVTGIRPEAVFRGSDQGAAYDMLSPTGQDAFVEGASYGEMSPPTSPRSMDEMDELHQVYRTIATTSTSKQSLAAPSSQPDFTDVPGVRDSVHFCSYGPAAVAPSARPFSFTVWSFLLSQRAEMRELASTFTPEARQISVETKMSVRRGALVHVSLEVPPGFVITSDSVRGFSWEGEISNVVFSVLCTNDSDIGKVIFTARIIVGSDVALLKSYVMVASRQLEPAELEGHVLESWVEVLEKKHIEIPFNDLELHELVGEGNFGDARRATYKGEDVVVKTLKASEFGETTDQIVREFQHEAVVLSMFGHHPCIVPFVGASTDVRYPLALITKYLPQGSLENHLRSPQKRTSLTIPLKTQMLRDAAAGLLNIHEGGFIHRDIAARNCLVDDDYRIKICDFGLCRRVNGFGGTLMKDGSGPLKYMAPETLQPPHMFSYESDSWMFGVLMWETFTASTPFQNVSATEAMQRIINGERLPTPSGLPNSLESLMKDCFVEPAGRPTMQTILTNLTAACAQLPSSPAAAVTTAASAALASSIPNATYFTPLRRNPSLLV